jgi:hypothetical protein
MSGGSVLDAFALMAFLFTGLNLAGWVEDGCDTEGDAPEPPDHGRRITK